MSRFALVVSFTPKPGTRDAFLRLVRENARASVRDEPGCYRFDVLTSDDADHVLLYEIYADARAFDDHIATPHFKRFDDASRDLVAAKTVASYLVLENAKEHET
jgi:(4S)-4-hydroxy-5-phosphonooxypentane-2,3-dione isomerase